MRSALLCVLFALTVHKESSWAADEEFRPTPIPLTSWNIGGAETGAGTLQETLATDAPPAVAAVPAHYWEDALRHSVYLTLVRDKIDQLISKTEHKPDSQPGRDVDDHDLWEKIKKAPFDRLNAEEPSNLGDVAVMAKGRLLDETDGFRFTEDELTKEKCRENCTESVKAFWSVKRVRQRDTETVPGKHHYELTFSVSSQTPKKQNSPHENPVRTFTVREGTPVERPQHRPQYFPPTPAPRPQRAIWVHKNIVPQHPPQQPESALDRLFFSWFGSDDSDYEPPVKKIRYTHNYPTRSKVGHVGSQSEQYHQKQLVPYTYKPHSYKVARPLGPPPVQQYHYNVDSDPVRHHNQYTPPTSTDSKHVSSNIIKTTKPAVLPTPPSAFPESNVTANISSAIVETTTVTRDSDIITAFTSYSKPKPTKVNYFHEHVRPPVFNAPPGVFVTMDHKKPFKPMPPLKFMHSSKPSKHKPVDFRPSPQVLDVQFSDPDPLSDAFRPITMSYAGSNTTESSDLADSDKLHHLRKPKPPKKHDKGKPQRTTTNAPEIITAYNGALDDIHWANILEAYTKTTSMDFLKPNVTETTSSEPFTMVSSEATVSSASTATEPAPKVTVSTTTGKPRRTRPTPKFENQKPMKVKKHKRVTSTTSTTTTTVAPPSRRPVQDLTPQASSSSVGGGNQSETQSNVSIENITVSTTPMSANVTTDATSISSTEYSALKINPTTPRSTTTRKATTRQTPTTTKEQDSYSSTEAVSNSSTFQPRNNRFRQQTLMIKGTSVKHDKWNVASVNRTHSTSDRVKTVYSQNSKPLRRKGSNFHGYVSPTPKSMEEYHRENHVDQDLHVISISSTTETVSLASVTTGKTQVDTAEQIGSELSDVSGTDDPDEDADEDEEDDDDDENQENDEYNLTTAAIDSNESSNEVEAEIVTTTAAIVDVATANYAVKNKTKCKNKKQNNTTTHDASKPNYGNPKSPPEDEVSVKPITTTEKMSTSDFFDEIFGLNVEQNETGHNRPESRYVDNDDDLEEFLQSINRKPSSNETNDEYSDEEKDESPFNNDEENRFPRNVDRTYDDYEDHPLSFLELMAMD